MPVAALPRVAERARRGNGGWEDEGLLRGVGQGRTPDQYSEEQIHQDACGLQGSGQRVIMRIRLTCQWQLTTNTGIDLAYLRYSGGGGGA